MMTEDKLGFEKCLFICVIIFLSLGRFFVNRYAYGIEKPHYISGGFRHGVCPARRNNN